MIAQLNNVVTFFFHNTLCSTIKTPLKKYLDSIYNSVLKKFSYAYS